MEDKFCLRCGEKVIDKVPPCPLQCMSPKCKAYQKKTHINLETKPIIWVLGGPGSGKGTQCDKLIQTYGFTYLSTGDLLREEVKKGSDRARCLTIIMDRGGLVPNDIILSLLKEKMEEVGRDAKGFLVDGYPREEYQGLEFERDIAPCTATVDTLLKRLATRGQTSKRRDDFHATQERRILTFMEHNTGVLEAYHEKTYKFDAEQAPDAIFAEVRKVMDPIMARAQEAREKLSKAPIDTSKKPIVWVLGGPGSGKGTQCERIIAKYGFTHLSTGDLLRAEVKSGSKRAKNLTAIMEQGALVPNEIVLELLKEAIEAQSAHSNGFLVDGYPREKSQGIAFEQVIAPVSAIIYFEVSSETLTKRLLGRAVSSGRADDNEDTIKLRLKTFLDNNQQVLDQYPDKINRINAEASVDAIFGEVQKILDPLVAVTA